MILKRSQIPIAVVTSLYLIFFAAVYTIRKNYEFYVHIFVLLFFAGFILYSNRKVNYPNWMLWALSAWGFFHMSGGALYLGPTRLYELILVPLSQTLPLLRYDQIIHAYGFGLTTLVIYHLIKPQLKTKKISIALGIALVLAGTGAGAVYEIIEFVTTLIVSEHGVGGYINNSLDLVFNFLGALLAVVLLKLKEKL